MVYVLPLLAMTINMPVSYQNNTPVISMGKKNTHFIYVFNAAIMDPLLVVVIVDIFACDKQRSCLAC